MKVIITINDIAEFPHALARLNAHDGAWLTNREHHPGELLHINRPVDDVMKHWGVTKTIGDIRIIAADETRAERKQRLAREQEILEAREAERARLSAEIMSRITELSKL